MRLTEDLTFSIGPMMCSTRLKVSAGTEVRVIRPILDMGQEIEIPINDALTIQTSVENNKLEETDGSDS
jgi:hypothetical protein